MTRNPRSLTAVVSVFVLLGVQVGGSCQRETGVQPGGPDAPASPTIPEIVMLPCSLGAYQLLVSRLVTAAEKAHCPPAQVHFRATSEGGGWGLMGGGMGMSTGGVVRVRQDYLTGEGWPHRISLMVPLESAPALAEALAALLGHPPSVTFGEIQPLGMGAGGGTGGTDKPQGWMLDAMFVLPTWGTLGPAGMSLEVYGAGNTLWPQVQDFLKRYRPAAGGRPGEAGAATAPAAHP